ncbi:unnamed protein product [Pylaiella littoralis]
MLSRGSQRFLLSTTSRLRCLKQQQQQSRSLFQSSSSSSGSSGRISISRRNSSSNRRTNRSSGPGGASEGWGQQQGAGGGGWGQNGTSILLRPTRSSRFRDVVPLPWLAFVLFQAVEFGLAVHEVETEEPVELIKRCNFHIATATAGDAANLTSLGELLDLVHHSVLATGPTALPKLLDDGVLGSATRAAESPNAEVAAAGYVMLTLLSQNKHVAQRMSRDPAVRALLVGELRQQEEEEEGEELVWEEAQSAPAGSFSPQSSMGVAGGAGEGGVEAAAARPPPTTIVVDPVHLTLTLETLSNVMRASRCGCRSSSSSGGSSGSSSSSGSDSRGRIQRSATSPAPAPAPAGGGGEVGDTSSEFEETGCSSSSYGSGGEWTMPDVEDEGDGVPWPFRLLYGEDNFDWEAAGGRGESGWSYYDEGAAAATGRGEQVSSVGYWPLERKIVADIAELMLSAASARDSEGGVARGEDAELGEILESAAAATLREISCHPPLVGMLLRRRPLVGLVAVSQDSMMAEQASSEGAIKICKEYRRRYHLPEPTEPKIPQDDVISWVDKTLAEEWAGSSAGDLGPGRSDQAFVRQAERSIAPTPPHQNTLLNLQVSVGVGMALGVPWGAARRWMAWRRAGEIFSAVSKFSLPRALLTAGLRAGLGATALIATHGPAGFRVQARPWVLDATSGKRGTLAMSAARETAELGYLYAVLRLCPYSLLPSLAVSAVVWNDHR